MGQSASVQKGTHFNLVTERQSRTGRLPAGRLRESETMREPNASVPTSRDLYRGSCSTAWDSGKWLQNVVAISKEKERIMKSLPVLVILLVALGASWAGQ